MSTLTQQLAYSGAYPTGNFIHVSGPRTLTDSYLANLRELVTNFTTVENRPTVPRRKLPKKVLVGIETNPGPKGIMRGARRGVKIASDVASIIQTLKSGRLIPPMKTKKKKNNNAGSSVASALTIRAHHERPANGALQARSLNTTVKNSHSITLPFDCVGVPLYTNAAGDLVWGTAVSTQTNLEIDPNQSITGTWTCFGSAVANIAGNFRRYRILNLRILWEPSQPVSATGSIGLAFTTDGGVNTTTPFTLNGVLSYDGALQTAVGVRGEVFARGLDPSWKYTGDSSTPSAANTRFENAGVIVTSKAVVPVVSTLQGFIRFVGTIQLMDLGTPLQLLTKPTSLPPTTDDSCSSSSSISQGPNLSPPPTTYETRPPVAPCASSLTPGPLDYEYVRRPVS